MGLLTRISYHLRYLSYAAGRRVRFGPRRFGMHGYFPNKFYTGRSFEPYLGKLIAEVLRERAGAFIDVGTNVGQTLAKVLAADPHRQYVGFEPQISCAFYVDEFLRENGIETAQIIPVGLWESSKFVTLHVGAEVDESASMADWSPRAQDGARKRVLSVVRGDEAIAGLGIERIAAIKVDVEGAELFVLRGLEATLRREHPALFFEVLPNFTGFDRKPIEAGMAEVQRERAMALFAFLSALNYHIHQIRDDGTYFLIDAFQLDDPVNFAGRDYLAMERH